MVHIRQPFFSIITAMIFMLLGLVMAQGAGTGESVAFGAMMLNSSAGWALSGLMFLMAYFALIHLKD